MKNMTRSLIVLMILLGVCSFSNNIDESEELEDNKILEKVFIRLENELKNTKESEDHISEKTLNILITILESELKEDNTGEVAGMLGMIYGGTVFGAYIDEVTYKKFLDTLNLTFEDGMKLSEKYLLISMEKGNIESSYIYLSYIYALQKKYDLSEKYYEKFREYYKKHNSDVNFLDARSERMFSNELKAGLIYRIVLDDREEEYSFSILHEIMEEFIPMYPPNYDIIIKYTLRALELGHTELKKDLGDLYYKKDDFKLAEKYYREFLELKNIENYLITDSNKLDCIRKLENLLSKQGRKLEQKYIIMSKELESKISKK